VTAGRITLAKSLNMLVLATISTVPLASAADLLETYQAAQSQDAVFAAARAAHQASLEKLPQGRSLLLPSVSLNANSTYNTDVYQYTGPIQIPGIPGGQIQFPAGTTQFNSYGYGLTLVQPLFRQQNWVAYTESELQVVQAEAQLRIAQNDLILRVAQAYFDVLIAQDSVELAEAQKAAISEQLEQAKRNFEVGTATVTDTYEAQARYDSVNAQEIAAQSNLEIKKRMLQQLTNSMPDNLRHLGKQFDPEAPKPADVEKWVEQAGQHNLQLAVAQAADELAQKEVARNRGGHYPTVDLVASYADNHAGGGNFFVGTDTRMSTIGVQLNVPLYQGGYVNSKWREAAANRDRARDELENARRSSAVQTRQAYLGVVNGMAQVKALQQALVSSESVLEASKLGQEVGVRTNLDVLNAQQQVYSTRRDLYQAEYNYLLSELQLKAATGVLTEEDLAAVNRALY
jgi:outer membrane protein